MEFLENNEKLITNGLSNITGIKDMREETKPDLKE